MPKTASIKVNLANNTLAGNSAAVLAALSAAGLLPASDLDTDATMAADSDAKVPSQKATRAYVASVLAGVSKNKGPLDCSANPNYPVALNGDFYRCSVAGKVGGASGIVVEVADLIMCVADNAGGTQAGVGTSWIVGQANIAGITAAGLAMLQAADATAQAALLAAVTETLTNKRITPRIGSATSSATPTINTDNVDRYDLTAQAADITSFTSNLSGTPTNGQALWISVTGTAARAITWGASFENGAATLPNTTVSTDRLDVLFVWNAVTSKWRCTLTTVAAGLSDAPSNGHPYARKDGAWARLEDSVLYLPTFATNVTSIAGWSVTGDTPVLVGTDVKFADPGSITSITTTDDFDTGATLDFSLLTGLTSIGSYAFYGQSNLTGALVLPDSLPTIGSWVFAGCSGFTGDLTIPSSVTTIDTAAFLNCYGFTGTLTIPSSVTSIGNGVFSGCSGFTGDLTIPSSVTTIENSAFYGCSGFTGTLTIPSSVTSIGSYVFFGCSGLTTVNAYVELSVIDVADVFLSSGVTDIHARSSDGTWTAGAGQTIGGKTDITVTKDL